MNEEAVIAPEVGLILDQVLLLLDGWLKGWIVFESGPEESLEAEDLRNSIVCRIDGAEERDSWTGVFVPTIAYGDWIAGRVIYTGELLDGGERPLPMRFCTSTNSFKGTTFLSSLQPNGSRVVRRMDRHPSGDMFVSVRQLQATSSFSDSISGSVVHGRRDCSKCGPRTAQCQCSADLFKSLEPEITSSWTQWQILRQTLLNADPEAYVLVSDNFRRSSEGGAWIPKSKDHSTVQWRYTMLSSVFDEPWGPQLLQAIQACVPASSDFVRGQASQDVGYESRSKSGSESVSASPPGPSSSVVRPKRRERKKKVLLQCDQCTASFPTPSRLERHVRGVHLQLKSYSCIHCFKMFSQNCHLIKHMQDVHEQRRDHECPECHKKFASMYKVKRHMVVHRGSGPECPVCGIVVSEQSSLKRHLRRMHGSSSS